MRSKSWIFLLLFMLLAQEAVAQGWLGKRSKKAMYEEVDFEDMIRRYFGKEKSSPLEGIYSVSCVITKKTKRFLSKRERFSVVERKDNYARVAILRDWPASKRDYIEVSMSYRDAKRYPIVGELSVLSEGQGLIYKHLEPDGTAITFSMINESLELLEAEYSQAHKRRTITYKLSYLKIYPKASEITVSNDY